MLRIQETIPPRTYCQFVNISSHLPTSLNFFSEKYITDCVTCTHFILQSFHIVLAVRKRGKFVYIRISSNIIMKNGSLKAKKSVHDQPKYIKKIIFRTTKKFFYLFLLSRLCVFFVQSQVSATLEWSWLLM